MGMAGKMQSIDGLYYPCFPDGTLADDCGCESGAVAYYAAGKFDGFRIRFAPKENF